MSTHTLKSNRRHPDADRQRIQVGHITFEYSIKNKTFALKACEAVNAKDRRPLFRVFIEKVRSVNQDIITPTSKKALEI